MFPDHISEILNRFGVRADTKAVLYDLYLTMGNNVLERFADMCESATSLSHIKPEDLIGLRRLIIDHYLRLNHPRWLDMMPTPSLWHPRLMEGRASGLAVPMGLLNSNSESANRAVGEENFLRDRASKIFLHEPKTPPEVREAS